MGYLIVGEFLDLLQTKEKEFRQIYNSSPNILVLSEEYWESLEGMTEFKTSSDDVFIFEEIKVVRTKVKGKIDFY